METTSAANNVSNEIKESEERYRRLVEMSPDMYFLQSGGIINYMNKAGLDMLGATKPDDIVGKSIYDIVHPDYHELVRGRIAAIEAGEASMPFVDQQYVRLDGSTIAVEVAAVSAGADDKQTVEVIARDVSARKLADTMAIRALAAEQAEQVKANLLSTVSHELRTPLTAVRGYASTLLEYHDRLEKEEIDDCIRGIDAAAQYLEKIVSDLLTLTRIDSGVFHLDLHDVRLGEFLEKALSARLVAAPDMNLGLQVPSRDPLVRVDAVRLQQVVNNLLDNAIKYAGKDSPMVVTVRNRPEPMVVVRDHGPGVPDDSLDEIFAPFIRLKSEETSKISGSGLGLAVCRGIVQAHGGRIWASRPRGGGLQVSFTLPKAA